MQFKIFDSYDPTGTLGGPIWDLSFPLKDLAMMLRSYCTQYRISHFRVRAKDETGKLWQL